MRFERDDNMPESLAVELTAAGHDAATCLQEGLAGAGDPSIAAHSASEGRILRTFDLDFADICRYPPGSHPGIVIFRLHSQDVPTCLRAFTRLCNAVAEPDFAGSLIVVEDVRIRRA